MKARSAGTGGIAPLLSNPQSDAAKEAERFNHLAKSPYQVASPGSLFKVSAEALAGYDRPGLDRQAAFESRVAALGGSAVKGARPEGLLASVRNHPARHGPVDANNDIPSVAAMWPKPRYAAMQVKAQQELGSFTVQSTDGSNKMSLLDKISDPQLPLSDHQRNRVLQCFGEYKNSLDEMRPFDTKASDENWNHICHEAAQVIDAGLQQGLSADQLEDALLASMFSDSVKFGSTLLTHNIHGAIAADIVLTRRKDKDMPPERVAGIVQATKEHQVGVPGLFSKLTAMFIGMGRGFFPGMDRSTKFSPEEEAALDSIVAKISNPINGDHTAVDPQTGARAITFTDAEKALLAEVGIHEWPVPDPNTPWFDASMNVIYADSAQYAMPDGVGKIQLLSGPGTFFKDDTVFLSAFSCGVSALDCGPLVLKELMPLFERGTELTQNVLRQVGEEVDAELKGGGVVFDRAELAAVVKNYGVEMDRFTQHDLPGDKVRIDIPGDDGSKVPFFHVALDYSGEGTTDDREYAKLIRSRVANQMRGAVDWMGN